MIRISEQRRRRSYVDVLIGLTEALTAEPKLAQKPLCTQGSYLCQSGGHHIILAIMERIEPTQCDEQESAAADLARRLARYRSRIAAEGRPRSVRLIDQAIADAGRKRDGTE